jgi:hypothetical protein
MESDGDSLMCFPTAPPSCPHPHVTCMGGENATNDSLSSSCMQGEEILMPCRACFGTSAMEEIEVAKIPYYSIK